ncbi:LysR family transcriptional regulator [Nocardia sp. NPDC058640]|uniref:LysR family transcriptional regulator n=1 Tax=Nocardia sp. NPDC058640 TaxID=3346571 RepID=UPI00365503E5
MNWQEIETFLALAEELHFGRTADRLLLSRARVSQMIQSLEDRVGASLFERTSRRVSLTPLGIQLRDDLIPHHRGVLTAVAQATDTARGIDGVLRVGFSSPLASKLLIAAREAFRSCYPGCAVDIREVPLSDRYSGLRSGELDLQLIEFPATEPDLVCGPVLILDPRVLAVSTRNPLSTRDTVTIDDLVGETVLFIGGVPGYFLDEVIPAHTPGGAPIHRSATTASWQELLAHVAADAGVTVTAAQGIHYYPRPDLAYIPFTDATPIRYGLQWRASGMSTLASAFVRAAVETSPVGGR